MRRLLPLLAVIVSVACLTPDDVPQPRWFRPLLVPVESGEASPSSPELRLAPVTAGQHLRERIAWRRDGVEYGYYELSRWTETPAEVVTQAVQAALFGTGHIRRSLRSDVPKLHVQVRAFEEVIDDEGDRIEVQLLAVVEGPEGDALYDKVFTGSAPVDGDPLTTARELGTVTAQLAGEMAAALSDALATWNAAQG